MSVDPKKFGITPSLVDAVKLTLESKSLAALAPPRDKVTHKDVLVGRGVLKKHPQDPDKHVVAKEEAEQVDELKGIKAPGEREKYVNKAKASVGGKIMKAGLKKMVGLGEPSDRDMDTIQKRVTGIARAGDRRTAADLAGMTGANMPSSKRRKMKEEAEQVDELSKGTLGSYVNKAAGSAATHTGAAAAYGSSSKNPNAAKMAQHQAIATKRTAGIQKAVGKLTKEDVDHVAEADVKNAGPKVKDEYKNFHDKFKSHSKENQAKITSNLRKGMSYKDAIKNVSEADGSSNPSTSSSALDKINSIATDMKKMASEPLKAPKDPGAVKKLPNVNAPGAPDMFKTEAVADPMAAKKAEVQKKIAQKQATAVQAKANKRMSNINASNDKCSCGSTNESKMKCEVHSGGMKGGKEKIEVNPPLREAEDLPKKVITKGHEIAKSLIKNRSKVREPYAVGMAQAKKSAGIKN
jgi:hypothetical protein